MESIIIRPAIAKVFEKFIKSGRVLFISAPCGFGKTVLADALLRRMQVCRLETGTADFALPSPSDGWDVKRRSEAKTVAKRLRLVPESM